MTNANPTPQVVNGSAAANGLALVRLTIGVMFMWVFFENREKGLEPRDIVFLQKQIKKHARNNRYRNSGLKQAPVGTADAGLLTRIRENKRHGEGGAAVHNDQGAKKFVPRSYKSKQRDGHDRGSNRWQANAGENLPVRGAVHNRRLFDFPWHGFKTVANYVEAERDLDRRVDDSKAQ